MARSSSRLCDFDGLGINNLIIFHDTKDRDGYDSVMTLMNNQAMTSQSLFFPCPIARPLLDQTLPWKMSDLSRMRQPPAKRGELGTGHRVK